MRTTTAAMMTSGYKCMPGSYAGLVQKVGKIPRRKIEKAKRAYLPD
jgi:hypothetical protein